MRGLMLGVERQLSKEYTSVKHEMYGFQMCGINDHHTQNLVKVEQAINAEHYACENTAIAR